VVRIPVGESVLFFYFVLFFLFLMKVFSFSQIIESELSDCHWLGLGLGFSAGGRSLQSVK
jgi:hypothetical protein